MNQHRPNTLLPLALAAIFALSICDRCAAGNSGQPQNPEVSGFPGAGADSLSICFSTNSEDQQGNCFTWSGR